MGNLPSATDETGIYARHPFERLVFETAGTTNHLFDGPNVIQESVGTSSPTTRGGSGIASCTGVPAPRCATTTMTPWAASLGSPTTRAPGGMSDGRRATPLYRRLAQEVP